jgi:hypothetical protein
MVRSNLLGGVREAAGVWRTTRYPREAATAGVARTKEGDDELLLLLLLLLLPAPHVVVAATGGLKGA